MTERRIYTPEEAATHHLGPRCTPIDEFRRMRSQEAARRPEFHLGPHHRPAVLEIESRAEIHLKWLIARISARIEREEQRLRAHGADVGTLLTHGERQVELIEQHHAASVAFEVLQEARRRRRAKQWAVMDKSERQHRAARAKRLLSRMAADEQRRLENEADGAGWAVDDYRAFMQMSEDELWQCWTAFYAHRLREVTDQLVAMYGRVAVGGGRQMPLFVDEGDMQAAVRQWRLEPSS